MVRVGMQESNKSCHKDKKLLIAVSNHSIDHTKYKVAAKYALMRGNSPSKQPLFVKVVVSHSLIQSNPPFFFIHLKPIQLVGYFVVLNLLAFKNVTVIHSIR